MEQAEEIKEMLDEEKIPDEVYTTKSNAPTNSPVVQKKLDNRLSSSTSDPDIKKDAEFLEKFNEMMTD